PTEGARPTAIKVPSAFGPHDAELFRRLGREADMATLLSHILNDQIDLVVIYGDSGAGKTSLLRAGLPCALTDRTLLLEYHCWEAMPRDAEKRLVAAMQHEWQTPPDAPQKLMDIFGPATGPLRRVIVLDQFEQISPERRSVRPLFQLFKYAVTVA